MINVKTMKFNPLLIVAAGAALLVAPAASAATLFQDNFTGNNGLITNEYAYWNKGESGTKTSPNWEMTSGSLFRQNGIAWTGTPDSCDPNANSSNCTNSDTFRLNTTQKFGGDIRVSLSLRQNKDIHSSNCSSGDTCWHGTHIWLRYQSQYDLYYASVNRADGQVVLKRKVPCGDDNSGTYFVLGSAKYDWKASQWGHYSATVENNSDGSVTIKVYDDDKSTTVPIVTGVDKGGTNPNWSSGCSTPGKYSSSKYPPITAAGAVGVRGDYADFNFDDFTVTDLASAVANTSSGTSNSSSGTTTGSPTGGTSSGGTSPEPGNTSSTSVSITTASDPSMTGMWKLDGNANDINGNNGSVKNGVQFSAGKVDLAAFFNGNNYIEIPDKENLSPSVSGQKITVAFWMNPATFKFSGENAGYVHLLGKGEPSNHEWTFRMYNDTAYDGGSRAKRVSFYAYNLSGGLGAGSYFQDDLKTNEWIFVAGVIDGANTLIYKNGALRDKDPLSGYNIKMGNGKAPVRIGTRDFASYFQGGIDNVRVYNRVLSASEINQLYQDDLNAVQAASASDGSGSTSQSTVTIATSPLASTDSVANQSMQTTTTSTQPDASSSGAATGASTTTDVGIASDQNSSSSSDSSCTRRHRHRRWHRR